MSKTILEGSMSKTILQAPLRGWLGPLTEVPDEVFSGRVLGDGFAIDPTAGALHAPCDGLVVSIPDSKHAIALRADSGAELLMHIGIDTVALAGRGFETHVRVGDRVRAQQRLITFDLQAIAPVAKSLITPIVLTNGDDFELVDMTLGCEVELGSSIGQIVARRAVSEVAQLSGTAQTSRTVRVTLEHGVHARPAATIAQVAKSMNADVVLRAHGRTANAKSPVAMLTLGIKRGDDVVIVATGSDGEAALTQLSAVLSVGTHTHEPQPAVPARLNAEPEVRLRAVVASRGLAVGRAVWFEVPEIVVPEQGRGVALETEAFEQARNDVRVRLDTLRATAHATAQEVIAAHLEFLDDWELVAAARRTISQGKSAAFAWRRAVRESAETLRALGDARLTERIDDLLDLEVQMLQALVGVPVSAAPVLSERAVILCDDLKPSQFVALEMTRVVGICMAEGGPTSHVAILAAALGIPMLVAAGSALRQVETDQWLVLDAENGLLHMAPDRAALEAAEATLRARQERKQLERASAQVEARTRDGERIEVFANLGSLAEVPLALANGAEGCGLLRTEFLFLERSAAPDEAEQHREYQAIATALGDRALIVRTLDIGGDKPIPYLPLPTEANPALGLRGIRTSLWRPDLLRTQLRAILRVAPQGQCRLLLPMVTDLAELRGMRRVIQEVARELGIAAELEIGVMIETPAAAMLAEQLARECDFFSIGTNDLTQYTLAMDRTHAELASRIDGLHPAVLRLIERVTAGARRSDRLVAVCGNLASDSLAVPILIGLGVRELSVAPAAIPTIKAVVRDLTLDAAATLSRAALELESAEAVRALVREGQRNSKVTV